MAKEQHYKKSRHYCNALKSLQCGGQGGSEEEKSFIGDLHFDVNKFSTLLEEDLFLLR